MRKIFLLFFFIPFCFSCNSKTSDKTSTQPILTQRELEKIIPKDEVLAEKYSRSCTICHANPDALAPLVSDNAAWDKLLKAKGIEGLLKSVNEGIKSMPPKGQCLDCTPEDYEKLIYFMAGLEK